MNFNEDLSEVFNEDRKSGKSSLKTSSPKKVFVKKLSQNIQGEYEYLVKLLKYFDLNKMYFGRNFL